MSSSKCSSEGDGKINFQLTEPEEETLEDKDDIRRRKSSQFLNLGDAFNQSLKRVNSTSNLGLLPLSLNFSSNSKSLPPTPQHSLRYANFYNVCDIIFKKNSYRSSGPLQPCGLFQVILTNLESYKDTNERVFIDDMVLQLKGIGEMDELIDMAKEYGCGIYSEMEVHSRIRHINDMVSYSSK